jgi:hypothetical protein
MNKDLQKIKRFLTYGGRLHSIGHTKGREQQKILPHPKHPDIIDEAVIEEGASGVRADHGQGE